MRNFIKNVFNICFREESPPPPTPKPAPPRKPRRRVALKVYKENVGEKGGRENCEVRSPQSWVGSLKRPSKITYPSPAARARSLSPERAAREGSIVPKRKVVAMTLRFPRDTYTSTIRKKSFSAKMI